MRKLSILFGKLLAVGIAVAFSVPCSAQQGYPSKPIRMILPYPPGGSTNVLARLVGQKLSESLGQTVVVENRPGGNGVIGTEAVASAAPDGYTLLLTLNAHVLTPLLAPTPYDPIKDFAPISPVARGEILLVTHPSVKANNLKELIALAKAHPGKLNYASAGRGSPLHLAAEYFNILAGVKITNIPYKGSGPAVADLLAGEVQLYFSGPAPSIPYVQNGKLRAIAYSGDRRFETLPQVPTFTEAGLPNYDASYWYGLLAPAGTPTAIIQRLAAELAKTMDKPDVKEYLISQGMQPTTSTPQQFADLMKADMTRFADIIKTAHLDIDR